MQDRAYVHSKMTLQAARFQYRITYNRTTFYVHLVGVSSLTRHYFIIRCVKVCIVTQTTVNTYAVHRMNRALYMWTYTRHI